MPSRIKISSVLAESEPPEVSSAPVPGAAEPRTPGLHRRNPWTGRCQACGRAFPCQRYAEETTQGFARPAAGPSVASVLAVAVPVLLGLLLVAVSVAGLVW